MNTILDVLFLRKPKIDYVSPSICEVMFSGSSNIIITLDSLAHLRSPTGLRFQQFLGQDSFLTYDSYKGQLCLSFYYSVDGAPDSPYNLIDECVPLNTVTVCQPGYYKISALTASGETSLSSAYLCTGSSVYIPLPQYPNTTGYNLYKNSDITNINGTYVLDAGDFNGNLFQICNSGCYRIGAITNEGESPLSDPLCVPPSPIPPAPGCLPGYNWDEATLSCKKPPPPPAVTFGITDWCSVRSDLVAQVGTSWSTVPSANPEWNGIFDHNVNSPAGVSVWYFLTQAVLGGACAANDNANYGIGSWADTDCYAQLYFLSGEGWQLALLDSVCGNLWTGIFATANATDPAGVYTYLTGLGSNVGSITVSQNPSITPPSSAPDWTSIVWDVAGLNVSGDATGTLVYSFSGDIITVNALNNGSIGSGFSIAGNSSSSPLAYSAGSLCYTGPACVCKLTITGSEASAPPFLTGIIIAQDGNIVLNQSLSSGTIDGVYTFNITAGVASKIQIGNLGAIYPRMFGSPDGGGGATNLTLTFSN